MERKLEATVMGCIGTTIRTDAFIPTWRVMGIE